VWPLQRQHIDGRASLWMYLDRCNLLIRCRGVVFRALMMTKMMTMMATRTMGGDNPGNGSRVRCDDGNYKDLRIATMIPSVDLCLTSRVRSGGDNHRHPSNGVISTIDWVLIFRLAPSSP
jgi:hypothetical protein